MLTALVFQDGYAPDAVAPPKIAATEKLSVQKLQEMSEILAGLQMVYADRKAAAPDCLLHCQRDGVGRVPMANAGGVKKCSLQT